MTHNNEGKCLYAIVNILMRRHGVSTYKIIERDGPDSRGIELVCEIDRHRYALEHTVIEPFPDQRKDGVAFDHVLGDSFQDELKDLLKPDLMYSLNAHVYAFAGRNRKELAAIRQSLLTWARSVIPALELPRTRVVSMRDAQPPEVPVPVRLTCRRSASVGGQLYTGRFAPEPLEEWRVKRILKALKDKGPKLQAAKSAGPRIAGTHTILVLENNDIALTNESVVLQAITEAVPAATHLPDDIYMIDMSTAHVTVTQLQHQGATRLVDEYDPSIIWEFKMGDLGEI